MISYSYDSDTWLITHYPGEADEFLTNDEPIPTGEATVMAHVDTIPAQSSVGLFVRYENGVEYAWVVRQLPPEDTNPAIATLVYTQPVWLRMEFVDDEIMCSFSVDGEVWFDDESFPLPDVPGEAGVVLMPDPQDAIPVMTSISQYRLFAGYLPDPSPPPVFSDIEPVGEAGPSLLTAPTIEGEPVIHGIIGAQFGDLEYDVGKSVRWAQYYCDDLFITDVATGEQRLWVVNWAESFPQAKFTVSGTNFWNDPEVFREEQFEAGNKAFDYDDNDWCLFIDAHEGLSFDNRTLPDDYVAAPFISFIYREIDRAVTAGRDYAVLPFFVYLSFEDLQNVTYESAANDGAELVGVPPLQQAISVPWYQPAQGLTRLVKVSALRSPTFDWGLIDQILSPSPAVKAQIISYGYAHWNMQDIPPGETTVPPLDATNDLGWEMRKLISRVRPIFGLPYVEPWKDPSLDTTGYPGPWCVDTTSNVDPAFAATVEEDGHTAPDSQTAGVRIPLYDTVMRLNLRDGLWWEQGNSGNIPLTWDEEEQIWVPRYNPDEWPTGGVHSSPEPGEQFQFSSTGGIVVMGISGTWNTS